MYQQLEQLRKCLSLCLKNISSIFRLEVSAVGGGDYDFAFPEELQLFCYSA